MRKCVSYGDFMKNIIIEECPYCGSNDLTKGYQLGDGTVYRDKAGAFGTVVEHTICKECASIVYSKVEKPEILK